MSTARKTVASRNELAREVDAYYGNIKPRACACQECGAVVGHESGGGIKPDGHFEWCGDPEYFTREAV
jgi:hypothetical protein